MTFWGYVGRMVLGIVFLIVVGFALLNGLGKAPYGASSVERTCASFAFWCTVMFFGWKSLCFFVTALLEEALEVAVPVGRVFLSAFACAGRYWTTILACAFAGAVVTFLAANIWVGMCFGCVSGRVYLVDAILFTSFWLASAYYFFRVSLGKFSRRTRGEGGILGEFEKIATRHEVLDASLRSSAK